MGIEYVPGNKMVNCEKTGLATLAQNRFQALTLLPWEWKTYERVYRTFLHVNTLPPWI